MKKILFIFFVITSFVLSRPFPSDPIPGAGVIRVFFNSPWDSSIIPNIHYRKNDEQTWTPVPGVNMVKSDNSSYPNPPWYIYTLEANSLEFLFNDGKGNWYHGPGGSNFQVLKPGIYGVKDNQLFVIVIYPKKCPGVPICSDHGKCNSDTGYCECDANYYGSSCDKYCEPDHHIICPSGDEKICIEGNKCPKQPLPGCETFHDGRCVSQEIDMPSDFFKRNWQTPKRNSQDWRSSYQDYSEIQGYAHVVYDFSHTSANVQIVTFIRDSNIQKPLKYFFNGVQTSANNQTFRQADTKTTITLKVVDNKGNVLNLEPVDFMWNTHTPITLPSNYRNGQKGAIVELFGWPDSEIEKECALISKAGYLGVKLFPHQEQLMSYIQPFQNEMNPWYFMYQPVSYKLNGRMGTRDDLRRLISTCRKYNVRVYADAVINHMTGSGNDVQLHRSEQCVYWPGKNSTSGSPFFTQGFTYFYNDNTDLPPSQEFPGVPYGPLDFHCERALSSWTDPLSLNAGWLSGLVDLHTGRDYVRERIADYLTDLIGIGFSGFRIDAAKHICPNDLTAILTKFKRNMGNSLPIDFFSWSEILVGGERDLLLCNDDSGYNFGKYFENALRSNGFSDDDVLKIKIWSSFYPNEPDGDCGKVDRRRQVIQNDDHDQQNDGSSSRDMHDKGSVLVKDKDPAKHRSFEVKLFQDPYGVRDNDNEWPIRTVLSSYYFSQETGSQAIPDGLSDCSMCKITCDGCRTVGKIPASVDGAKAYDGSAGGMKGYTLVHRDDQIISAMRNWMRL